VTTHAIYIAGPLASAPLCNDLAAILGASARVVSRWHWLVAASGQTSSPVGDPEACFERAEILADNIADMDAATLLVAVCHQGRPKATFGEIAYALAYRKPVVWVQGFDGAGRSIWDSHALVTRVLVAPGTDISGPVLRELEAMR
jgi:nucleoside 2-deoxyribosyltransferase